MGKSTSDSSPDGVSSGYVTFLVVIALSGWTLASYDFNLLIVAFPDIAKELHLTASFVGLLGFIIHAAMFGITLFAGYGMDLLGRKKMWMWCLSGAAAFTGLKLTLPDKCGTSAGDPFPTSAMGVKSLQKAYIGG